MLNAFETRVVGGSTSIKKCNTQFNTTKKSQRLRECVMFVFVEHEWDESAAGGPKNGGSYLQTVEHILCRQFPSKCCN